MSKKDEKRDEGKFIVIDTEKFAKKMVKEVNDINPETLKKGRVINIKT